ncbi:endonuclease/exonuclease/phosphatase family protein [Geofilum rhodophaeum]|uniref:endonuclease/exonuclease/phosphatase family protein n=1 Tax=Geofilum rhodophaeum TaxID=1965019 RepID=UPI001314864A|nr:endonuclease/exonuclease/phosphatase family protein [Geofilum rhodophaeum]
MMTIWTLGVFLLVLVDLLPLVSEQHWFFRVLDFVRIQLWVLQALMLLVLAGPWIEAEGILFWVSTGALVAVGIHNSWVLFPYTPLYPKKRRFKSEAERQGVTLLSVNVYLFNAQYKRLLALIREQDPDVVLTMESNHAWEQGMAALEKVYPFSQKVALENTYGMHFYTRLPVINAKVHYLTADDLPSMEIQMETRDGQAFTFWGVHPPPPSPTEEPTSKERDSELLSVAQRVRKQTGPVVVAGDFNNVAWARSSILFRKVSRLIDPRIGRGFVSTFHARYPVFRFPIDLFFHSGEVLIASFKRLRGIGSDHFPLFCRFYLSEGTPGQKSEVPQPDSEEREEIKTMIKEGRQTESDRPAVAED